jgi:hypothetical protein
MPNPTFASGGLPRSLEVIASVFLGADYIVQPPPPCNNTATILNENRLIVQYAQSQADISPVFNTLVVKLHYEMIFI